MDIQLRVHAAGTLTIGTTAPLTVHRLGLGTMRLTGRGIWGEPTDRAQCLRVLRRAIELGVDLIDTADSYGPYVSEDLIREALHPYPGNLVIATKAGLVRTGPNQWHAVGRPEYLRQEVEMSLRRLAVERIDLFQLHRIDPLVPAAEQFGLLADLVREGKVHLVGLSNATAEDIVAAREAVPIATVQNRYNLTDRSSEDVLAYCQAEGIGFIPWNPIAAGQLAQPGGPVDQVAEAIGATPSQVALAWLLARSPIMLPIPGTAAVAHLEENTRAAQVQLTADQVEALTAATPPGARPG
jgi:aryl-alcohol dehydrogenase-like predicted oxidoreductase